MPSRFDPVEPVGRRATRARRDRGHEEVEERDHAGVAVERAGPLGPDDEGRLGSRARGESAVSVRATTWPRPRWRRFTSTPPSARSGGGRWRRARRPVSMSARRREGRIGALEDLDIGAQQVRGGRRRATPPTRHVSPAAPAGPVQVGEVPGAWSRRGVDGAQRGGHVVGLGRGARARSDRRRALRIRWAAGRRAGEPFAPRPGGPPSPRSRAGREAHDRWRRWCGPARRAPRRWRTRRHRLSSTHVDAAFGGGEFSLAIVDASGRH